MNVATYHRSHVDAETASRVAACNAPSSKFYLSQVNQFKTSVSVTKMSPYAGAEQSRAGRECRSAQRDKFLPLYSAHRLKPKAGLATLRNSTQLDYDSCRLQSILDSRENNNITIMIS